MASPDELTQLSHSIYLPKRPATATLLFPQPFSYRFIELIPQHRVSGFLFWPKSPQPQPLSEGCNRSDPGGIFHDKADSHPIRSPPSLVPWVSDRSLQNCHQLPLSNQAPQGGNKWWKFPTGEVAAWLFFFWGGGAGFGILLAVFVGNYWKLEIFLCLKSVSYTFSVVLKWLMCWIEHVGRVRYEISWYPSNTEYRWNRCEISMMAIHR